MSGQKAFDVFLSYNSQDKDVVRRLATALQDRGLDVWLDEEQLVPGRPWQEALEEIIQSTKAAAVLIGGSGISPWHDREMRALLSAFVDRRLPVIPTLLPGAADTPDLPVFLAQLTWVDLRMGLRKEGLDRLVWGITGSKETTDVFVLRDLIADVTPHLASSDQRVTKSQDESPGSSSTTLIIRHVDDSAPTQFRVVRLSDGKTSEPVVVPPPVGFAVEGRPQTDLMQELQWYLESFLDYPFPPETEHAERVQDALKAWGEQAFEALFGNRATGRWFDAATSGQYRQLQLQISSDDPRVLYWPWEALRDPEAGVLARTCQVERRLNKVRDPHPVSSKLPRDGVNILLVTARPYKADVHYRSISRPLVEQIDQLGLPASVTVLRPPTFDQLREHLRSRPHYYHILHFDGHGSYGPKDGHDSEHRMTMQGLQGQLVFEDDDGEPDPQPAETLSELLREYSVPMVVLNACQSAMVDERAEDAFASVAAGLLRSGVRSVVAMAYSLYVSGAQQFLPAFYRRLFETGQVADAVRAGRQQMLARPKRVCARGQFPLDDWLVPVLYEQDPLDVSFAREASAREAIPREERPFPEVPAEARDEQNPYGFVGRDAAVLKLERAMRRPPAGLLIHGLGGVGKTTLARGLIHWLNATNGLGQGCFWFSFQDIRSAEFVFNEMVGALFGTNALAADLDQKIEALLQTFREHRFLIVWDNFEVVRGIPGTSLEPTLSAEDRQRLQRFLQGLRGGNSKVLITSRNDEQWLEPATCYKLSLGGLEGEERWEYCETIVQDLGLQVSREDPDWIGLMDLLEGHPLAMRVVLPKLQNSSPSQLMGLIESNLAAFATQDQESAKLFATLEFAKDGLSPDLQTLLIPLAWHERFLNADLLQQMAGQVDETLGSGQVAQLTAALVAAGLLRERGDSVYEMHPALSRFLQLTVLKGTDEHVRDAWCHVFVNAMGSVADHYAPKELHEQRGVFQVLGATFQNALAEAERLEMDQAVAALTQSLAAYAQNERNFQAAADLFARLAAHHERRGNDEGQSGAYHQLGRIAQEQRDFASAEKWYRKSLAIKEKQGNEHGAAISYGQLGKLAAVQESYQQAGRWFLKAHQIFRRLDPRYAKLSANGFLDVHQQADEATRAKLKAIWKEAGLGELPEVKQPD